MKRIIISSKKNSQDFLNSVSEVLSLFWGKNVRTPSIMCKGVTSRICNGAVVSHELRENISEHGVLNLKLKSGWKCKVYLTKTFFNSANLNISNLSVS